jgi:CRP-like cAMP-binding protein
MLKLLAKKNLMLNQKIEILSKRTTKDKLTCYFDFIRGAAKRFTIPFNREELARYLCVDRSAMSSELCKMRDEGLIEFNKNEFFIL